MHSTGFNGPYCLTFRVRWPGASEQRENEGECRPRADIIFLQWILALRLWTGFGLYAPV
jgi:hypothetical protein